MKFSNLNYLGATFIPDKKIKEIYFYKMKDRLIPISLNFIDFMKIFYIDSSCDLNSCLNDIYVYSLNKKNIINVDNLIYLNTCIKNYSRPVANFNFYFYPKRRYEQIQNVLAWEKSKDFNIIISSVNKANFFEEVYLIRVDNKYDHFVSKSFFPYIENVYGVPSFEKQKVFYFDENLKKYVEK